MVVVGLTLVARTLKSGVAHQQLGILKPPDRLRPPGFDLLHPSFLLRRDMFPHVLRTVSNTYHARRSAVARISGKWMNFASANFSGSPGKSPSHGCRQILVRRLRAAAGIGGRPHPPMPRILMHQPGRPSRRVGRSDPPREDDPPVLRCDGRTSFSARWVGGNGRITARLPCANRWQSP